MSVEIVHSGDRIEILAYLFSNFSDSIALTYFLGTCDVRLILLLGSSWQIPSGSILEELTLKTSNEALTIYPLLFVLYPLDIFRSPNV